MTTSLSLSTASISDLSSGVDLTNLPSRVESFRGLNRLERGPISVIRKRISQPLIDRALLNEPFEDFPRAVHGYYESVNGGDGDSLRGEITTFYRRSATQFLQKAFSVLTHIPAISFDITSHDAAGERKALDAAKATYKSAGLHAQIESLQKAYDGFAALRAVFAKTDTTESYSLDTVIPSRYLPELLLAAPVWFTDSKEKSGLNPTMNKRITHFCNLVGSQEFARVFQMYNLEPRPIKDFAGRDVIPLPFVELIERTRSAFDYLVIATPYHDLASKAWETQWQRNIDPFLFGFLEHVPEYMFFLGRWSGNGIFPGFADMIADTMEHIRENQSKLCNFQEYTPWYLWGKNPRSNLMTGFPRLSVTSWNRGNWKDHPLYSFATELLKHYETGKVFQFLRGELVSA